MSKYKLIFLPLGLLLELTLLLLRCSNRIAVILVSRKQFAPRLDLLAAAMMERHVLLVVSTNLGGALKTFLVPELALIARSKHQKELAERKMRMVNGRMALTPSVGTVIALAM